MTDNEITCTRCYKARHPSVLWCPHCGYGSPEALSEGMRAEQADDRCSVARGEVAEAKERAEKAEAEVKRKIEAHRITSEACLREQEMRAKAEAEITAVIELSGPDKAVAKEGLLASLAVTTARMRRRIKQAEAEQDKLKVELENDEVCTELEGLKETIAECLPHCVLDDGTETEANPAETVEYAGEMLTRETARAEKAEAERDKLKAELTEATERAKKAEADADKWRERPSAENANPDLASENAKIKAELTRERRQGKSLAMALAIVRLSKKQAAAERDKFKAELAEVRSMLLRAYVAVNREGWEEGENEEEMWSRTLDYLSGCGLDPGVAKDTVRVREALALGHPSTQRDAVGSGRVQTTPPAGEPGTEGTPKTANPERKRRTCNCMCSGGRHADGCPSGVADEKDTSTICDPQPPPKPSSGPAVWDLVIAEPNPTVRDMLKDWIPAHGYDGLWNDNSGCCCLANDLMTCRSDSVDQCQAGYRVPCDGECDDPPCGSHIVPTRPEGIKP